MAVHVASSGRDISLCEKVGGINGWKAMGGVKSKETLKRKK